MHIFLPTFFIYEGPWWILKYKEIKFKNTEIYRQEKPPQKNHFESLIIYAILPADSQVTKNTDRDEHMKKSDGLADWDGRLGSILIFFNDIINTKIVNVATNLSLHPYLRFSQKIVLDSSQ